MNNMIKRGIIYAIIGLIVAYVITTILNSGKEVRSNKIAILNQLNDPNVSIIIRDDSELFMKLDRGLPNVDLHYIPYGMEAIIDVIPVNGHPSENDIEKENK